MLSIDLESHMSVNALMYHTWFIKRWKDLIHLKEAGMKMGIWSIIQRIS